MHRQGAKKAIKDRSGRKRSMAGVGMITKGSSGRPKASPRGALRGHTRENQTTSTSVPTDVPEDFLNKLGEMYTAERELTLALPLVAKAAKSKDLKTLLRVHIKETKGHVKALEAVAKSLGRELPSESCRQMTKLIGEGVKIIAKRLVAGDKDQELIGAGRKIEQLEIETLILTGISADKQGSIGSFLQGQCAAARDAKQSNRPFRLIRLQQVDVAGARMAAADGEAAVRRLTNEEARTAFDLRSGPLLRAQLLRLAAAEHVVLLTMHHIASDGWSIGVLVREVAALYEAFRKGEASPLAELELQYADYAA